jgi:hypothetical protein
MNKFALIELCLIIALVPSVGAQTSTDSQAEYFPAHVFADTAHSRYLNGKLQDQWFSTQLRGLRESPLVGRRASDEPVYRFTLLPSFSHPVSVRLTIHRDGTGTVVTSIGKGYGGYSPKGILSHHSHEVKPTQIQELTRLLQISHFWIRPTEPNQQRGTDGTEWLIEAAEKGRYHVIDRWEGADMREVGLYFLNTLGEPGPEADLQTALE